MNERCNIAILGVGAMGCLFASRLVAGKKQSKSGLAKTSVTLVGSWRAQIMDLQRDGLRIMHLDGSQTTMPVHVTDKLSDVPIADLVLVLVKSAQTERAARQAQQILRPDGVAITLQNGLGNLQKLTQMVGANRAAIGVTSQAAAVVKPGLVQHNGNGMTYLASTPELETWLENVVSLFNEAGLETELVQNAESIIWGKLAMNAGINPLTALYEIRNGELLRNRELFRWLSEAVTEVALLAEAQGIVLPFSDPVEQAAQVCRTTAENCSSMLQDILRGAPTEIDAICGAVVETGRKLGIATPMNEYLFKQIKLKEAEQLAVDS